MCEPSWFENFWYIALTVSAVLALVSLWVAAFRTF
jgi:hypothetical protein